MDVIHVSAIDLPQEIIDKKKHNSLSLQNHNDGIKRH